MKVIMLGYRSWAIEALEKVKAHKKIFEYEIVRTHKKLMEFDLEDWDLLISLGWSDELGEEVTNQISSIGLHCAALDRYSYGSPIQLQVIDGLTKSKHRIFPFLSDKISKRAHTHSREYSHEIEFSLEGGIEDIFLELTRTSIILLDQFISDYPDIQWKKWPIESIVRPKRKPIDSKINKQDLQNMSTKDLYNIIRCLEDPYPNAYIADEVGMIFFKKVSFVEK